MKGFALGLALKQRQKATQKSPISEFHNHAEHMSMAPKRGLASLATCSCKHAGYIEEVNVGGKITGNDTFAVSY